ncbi:MAG: ornithine cyclodeaminase family protein [Rhodothermia bacterium]|nr:ornithine cyclodeaminase family protein [Rhodothermia bacterium]
MNTLILSSSDTREIVRRVGLDAVMDRMIDALYTTLSTLVTEKTVVPLRSGFHYHDPMPGLIEWMPIMENGSRATIKVVGYHPENPDAYGIPTILGTVSSYDVKTGHLIGLADGTFLTALRTGAASGVATRIMASKNARIVGLIGCGAQAVAQLHAVSRVMDVREVLYYDIDADTVQSFPSRSNILGLDRTSFNATGLNDLIQNSDVICSATSVDVGAGPVFDDTETKPWLHINAAGSDFEGKYEIPKTLLKRSVVIPDVLQQAVSQGECQQLDGEHIGPELIDVIRNAEEHEGLRERLTVFDSTGWALEDHVALDLFMEYAGEFGLGSHIEIESVSHDAKNPYEFVFNGVADQNRPDAA